MSASDDLEIALEPAVPAGTSTVADSVTTADLDDGRGDGGPLRDDERAYLASRGFRAKVGQTAWLPGAPGEPPRLLVGVGPADAVDAGVIRRAAAGMARATRRDTLVATRLLDAVSDSAARPAAAQALAEGVRLGAYQFSAYKSAPEVTTVPRVVVVGRGGQRVAAALAIGTEVAAGVTFARDLVNTPGGDLTPARLGEVALELGDRHGIDASVLDESAIRKARLGGLLGVNRGSSQPPRFIQVTYRPPAPRGVLALVGKGITFDSGGLSLKTAAGMTTMKDDMGGAAAILGALSVLPAIEPKVEVRAYIPATDNMTGGDATRVGDVLRIRNGKTVEVLNTDAEGRLVLADGLSMASEEHPDAIVDLATLTGAIEVALGKSVAGLFGTRPAWSAQVAEAATRSGERVWELPIVDDYRSHLDSDVADLKNIGKPMQAGSIIAALFLREFVGDGIPWVHLDIAGTAWSESDDLELTKGGTGFGVRLLVELIRGFRRPPRR
jgi:leucyl aminopeptidase